MADGIEAAARVDRILDRWGYVDGPDTVRAEIRAALARPAGPITAVDCARCDGEGVTEGPPDADGISTSVTCKRCAGLGSLNLHRPAGDAGGAEAMAWPDNVACGHCGHHPNQHAANGCEAVCHNPEDNPDECGCRETFARLPLPPATAVEVASDYAALFDWLDERVGDGRGSVHLGLTDNGGVGCWLPGDETVPEGESVEEAIRFRMERLAAEAAAKGGARG